MVVSLNRGPQNRLQKKYIYIYVLIMGTPKRVTLILGKPHRPKGLEASAVEARIMGECHRYSSPEILSASGLF